MSSLGSSRYGNSRHKTRLTLTCCAGSDGKSSRLSGAARGGGDRVSFFLWFVPVHEQSDDLFRAFGHLFVHLRPVLLAQRVGLVNSRSWCVIWFSLRGVPFVGSQDAKYRTPGTAKDYCLFYGVGCTGGLLTSLSLQNNGLVGPIPSSVGNLGSPLNYLCVPSYFATKQLIRSEGPSG